MSLFEIEIAVLNRFIPGLVIQNMDSGGQREKCITLIYSFAHCCNRDILQEREYSETLPSKPHHMSLKHSETWRNKS